MTVKASVFHVVFSSLFSHKERKHKKEKTFVKLSAILFISQTNLLYSVMMILQKCSILISYICPSWLHVSFIQKIQHYISQLRRNFLGQKKVKTLVVRMQWMVCTLIVELEVNVQYLMTVNTMQHGEWTWKVWSASVKQTSTIGRIAKVRTYKKKLQKLNSIDTYTQAFMSWIKDNIVHNEDNMHWMNNSESATLKLYGNHAETLIISIQQASARFPSAET